MLAYAMGYISLSNVSRVTVAVLSLQKSLTYLLNVSSIPLYSSLSLSTIVLTPLNAP
jgi:hypothetical protein